ncbi:DUF4352 domain-containing protein [Bowdeniella massiliensis]|uniref:DUF4352 domain-containing protein n=1 Tax=Bowdeniella massiliensis TaxID=2932264 RepID=UPI002028895F|nr:DUF4352 domain-containing protein [Bowdeniella massiliensis]
MSTPQAPAPATEAKKQNWFARHKILTAILAVIVLAIIGSQLTGTNEAATTPASTTAPAATSAGGEAGSSDNSQETTDEPAEAEAAPGIGDTITAGAFEITITKIEPGISKVGPSGFEEKAQGQFVKVFANVKNTSNEAEYFVEGEQKLIDDSDRQHSASSSSIYLDESHLLFTEINPGNTAEGVMLFDIPTDAKPVAIDLKGGIFGSATRVSLQP